ncbi:NAD(+) synthase, partial [Neokomagataea sp. TBRC 2177]|nr:NAD(+) synthase [Neokomagataea anthophila]
LERMRVGQFGFVGERFSVVEFALEPSLDDFCLLRTVERFPFVPDSFLTLARDCYDAWTIQVSALRRRLEASRS